MRNSVPVVCEGQVFEMQRCSRKVVIEAPDDVQCSRRVGLYFVSHVFEEGTDAPSKHGDEKFVYGREVVLNHTG